MTKYASRLEDIPLHDEDSYGDDTLETAVFNYKFGDISLQDELAEQYSNAKTLYAAVNHPKSPTPANQKAQVLNTLTSILAQLTRAQAELHNIEQHKRLENALIETLRTLPEKAQKRFYELYEANNLR